MHPPDGAILGEPAVTLGLVDGPAMVRPFGPRDPLEDGRADTAPDRIRSLHSHRFSITAGSYSGSPRAPARYHFQAIIAPAAEWGWMSRCDTDFVMHSFANLKASVLS